MAIAAEMKDYTENAPGTGRIFVNSRVGVNVDVLTVPPVIVMLTTPPASVPPTKSMARCSGNV